MARAAGTTVDQRGPREFDSNRTLPLLIHGDAAFPGQGIVAETLNLARLDGYDTGGTIHIIANNQLGFTATSTRVRTARRTRAAWRAASRFPSSTSTPTIPMACIEAARLASAYRAQVPPRLPHRPDRLSAPRPQRRRRAELHAAAALREDRPRTRRCARSGRIALVERGELAAPRSDALSRKHFKVLEEALTRSSPKPIWSSRFPSRRRRARRGR